MAETGSGIRVRLRRMGGSYPGSRGLEMGELKEDDDYCRLERLVGGVGWWPLWWFYIYMRVYARMRRDVGRRGRRKKSQLGGRERKKGIKKEKDRQNEAIDLLCFV